MISKDENWRFNVWGRGEFLWVTADVDRIFTLIDTDVVDAHRSWKGQFVEINLAKIVWKPQIGNDILI